MIKLLLILIGIAILLQFLSFIKYYNTNIFKQEGTNFKDRLISLIKQKATIIHFIKLAYGCLIYFIAIIS